jgi:hypothetical protein
MIEVIFNTITKIPYKSLIGSKIQPPQKFNVCHFTVVDITFHVITSIQNFIQIHLSVRELVRGFFGPTSEFQTLAILMAEATGLENVASRSSSMAAPTYQISRRSTYRFKSY